MRAYARLSFPAPRVVRWLPQVYANPDSEEHPDLGFYHKKHDGKQQFLDNMGVVLSFECTWSGPGGYKRGL